MAEPCQGDTVATTGAGPAAAGVAVVTAEADRGVKAIDGAEGAAGAGGVDAIAVGTAAGFETIEGVAGFDAMRDVEGVEVIEGFEGAGVAAGAVLPELATTDFPGIGPAQDTAIQQKEIANKVAKADLDMCFPFDLVAGSTVLLVKISQFHKEFLFPRQRRVSLATLPSAPGFAGV